MDVDSQYRQRVISYSILIAVLVGVLFYGVCTATHLCIGGHLRHPLPPLSIYLVDGLWIFFFVVSAVLCPIDRPWPGVAISLILVMLAVSRLYLGSGGALLVFPVEIPLLIFLLAAAAYQSYEGIAEGAQQEEEN